MTLAWIAPGLLTLPPESAKYLIHMRSQCPGHSNHDLCNLCRRRIMPVLKCIIIPLIPSISHPRNALLCLPNRFSCPLCGRRQWKSLGTACGVIVIFSAFIVALENYL